MRSLVVVLSAWLVAVAACGFSGAGAGDVSGGPDGASPSSPDGEGGTKDGSTEVFLDSGVEAAVDAPGCTTLIDDAFVSPPGNWDALGDANIMSARAQLTAADNGGQSGAIWWKSPLAFGSRLTVTVDIALDLSTGNEGDGIAVGWVPTTTPYVIGPQGQSFGLCSAGMAGVGATFDTRDNQLAVLSAIDSSCGTSGGVVGFPALLAAKRFVLEITPTTLTLTTDNGGTVQRAQASATTGQLGITAATGSNQTGHAIKAVKVVSCP